MISDRKTPSAPHQFSLVPADAVGPYRELWASSFSIGAGGALLLYELHGDDERLSAAFGPGQWGAVMRHPVEEQE